MELPQPIKDLNDLEIRRHRRVWLPFMQKYQIESICEVGVFESQNFKKMLKHNPKIAVGVDSWIQDGNLGHNDSGFDQDMLDDQARYFHKLMMENPNIRMYRQYSEDAAKNFPDEYFDLIYIDGDHTYEGCKADLEAWWPKVKTGRFFTGDDYTNRRAPRTGLEFGVVQAVNEFAKKHGRDVYKLTNKGWAIIK